MLGVRALIAFARQEYSIVPSGRGGASLRKASIKLARSRFVNASMIVVEGA
jgi:hypothetical protein